MAKQWEDSMDRRPRTVGRGRAWSHWYWLLLPTYVGRALGAVLQLASNRRILGFPFFYAYQMIWVLISAVLTGIVFVATPQ